MRTGEAAGLKRLEEKALSAGSGPDGGYLVPETVEREICSRLAARLADPRHLVGARDFRRPYKRAFSTTGPATGWVGETAARPETDSADARRD